MFYNNNCKSISQTSDKFVLLSPEAFREAVSKDNVQLVDVRTPPEFRAGKIEGSVNIDFFQAVGFESKFQNFDKDKPLYIYCRSGSRSQRAAKKLLEMGFQKIYDLKGGYTAWNYLEPQL